jgi:hypothetical protein
MSTPLLGESLSLFELNRRPMSPREEKKLAKMRAILEQIRLKDQKRFEKVRLKEETTLRNKSKKDGESLIPEDQEDIPVFTKNSKPPVVTEEYATR